MLKYTGDPQRIKSLSGLTKMPDLGHIVTPTNYRDARDGGIRALAGPGHQAKIPCFSYNEHYLKQLKKYHKNLTVAIVDIQACLECSDDPLDSWLMSIFERRSDDIHDLMSLAESILRNDDDASAIFVRELYHYPDDKMLQNARNNLSAFCKDFGGSSTGFRDRKYSKRAPTPFNYDDQQIAAAFNRLIERYAFTGWTVQIKPGLANIVVRDEHSQILIPAGQRLSEPTLIRQCASKVESNLRGICNTRALFARLLPEETGLRPLVNWLAKSYNETVYAGAACLEDISTKATLSGTGGPGVPSPLYLIAMSYALPADSSPGQRYRANFAEVATQLYHELREQGYSNDRAATAAWDTAYHVFRGVRNAAGHDYLLTKDQQAFTGYYQLQRMQMSSPELRQLANDFSSLDMSEIIGLLSAHKSIKDGPLSNLLVPAFPHQHLALSEMQSQESSD